MVQETDDTAVGASLQGGDDAARREAARLMGQVNTEAKVRAPQENGKRGGRPKGMPVRSKLTRRKISEAKRRRDAERTELHSRPGVTVVNKEDGGSCGAISHI